MSLVVESVWILPSVAPAFAAHREHGRARRTGRCRTSSRSRGGSPGRRARREAPEVPVDPTTSRKRVRAGAGHRRIVADDGREPLGAHEVRAPRDSRRARASAASLRARRYRDRPWSPTGWRHAAASRRPAASDSGSRRSASRTPASASQPRKPAAARHLRAGQPAAKSSRPRLDEAGAARCAAGIRRGFPRRHGRSLDQRP